MGKHLYPRPYKPVGHLDIKPWAEVLAEDKKRREQVDHEVNLANKKRQTKNRLSEAGINPAHTRDHLPGGETINPPF